MAQVEFIKAARAAEARLDQKLGQQYGVTFPQWMVLNALTETGPIPSGDLAIATGTTRSNIVGILDRLERDGWIRRERSREDRRVVLVTLARSVEEMCAFVRAQ